MRKFIFILIIVLMVIPAFGENVTVLSDLVNPKSFVIDETQMYITEGAKIYIYSLKNREMLKVFGKAGSGPQEFLVQPQLPLQIDVSTDKIIVNSQGKVSFWKKDGTYIREKKVQVGVFSGFFKPLDDGYVGLRMIIEDKIMYFGVDFYDKEFQRKLLLLKQEHFFQQGKKMNPIGRLPLFSTSKGRVYIEDKDGKIHVFDKAGKKYPPIDHKFKPYKITQDHKDQILDFYKNDPSIKQFWNFFKDTIEFPSYFSNIQATIIADEKIYIQTYKREGEKAEFLIYKTDGKFLGRKMLLFRDESIIRPYVYSIINNKLYQIVENEDEEWELVIININ